MKAFNKSNSIAVIIVIITFNGCSPTMIPLKGKYADSPGEFTSTLSSDSLWSNITRIFGENGLGVKNIDKEKGLIVSKKSPFISVYTFEDNNGKLKEPDAWVVLEQLYVKKKQWYPKTIYGQWTIRMNKTETGETTIKIDPIVICTFFPNRFTSVEIHAQSTGNFERLVDSTLHNNLNKVSKN